MTPPLNSFEVCQSSEFLPPLEELDPGECRMNSEPTERSALLQGAFAETSSYVSAAPNSTLGDIVGTFATLPLGMFGVAGCSKKQEDIQPEPREPEYDVEWCEKYEKHSADGLKIYPAGEFALDPRVIAESCQIVPGMFLDGYQMELEQSSSDGRHAEDSERIAAYLENWSHPEKKEAFDQFHEQYFECGIQLFEQGKLFAAESVFLSLWKTFSEASPLIRDNIIEWRKAMVDASSACPTGARFTADRGFDHLRPYRPPWDR